MNEEKRGCGWRKVGGAYLVGNGMSESCDGLPLELTPCPTCEFKVSFSRGIQEIHVGYLAGRMRGHECMDKFLGCPLCYYAKEKKIEKFYLMFVSSTYYSTKSFIREVQRQGVSKRIAPQSLPKDFKIGEDWIFLAHNKVPFAPQLPDGVMRELTPIFEEKEEGLARAEPDLKRAIFYAFKPSRIEIVLWKNVDPREIAEWEEKGFTPVLIDRTPENLRKHGNQKRRKKNV